MVCRTEPYTVALDYVQKIYFKRARCSTCFCSKALTVNRGGYDWTCRHQTHSPLEAGRFRTEVRCVMNTGALASTEPFPLLAFPVHCNLVPISKPSRPRGFKYLIFDSSGSKNPYPQWCLGPETSKYWVLGLSGRVLES